MTDIEEREYRWIVTITLYNRSQYAQLGTYRREVVTKELDPSVAASRACQRVQYEADVNRFWQAGKLEITVEATA